MDPLDERLRALGSETVLDDGFTQRVTARLAARPQTAPARLPAASKFYFAAALATLLVLTVAFIRAALGPITPGTENLSSLLLRLLDFHVLLPVYTSSLLAAIVTAAILIDLLRPRSHY